MGHLQRIEASREHTYNWDSVDRRKVLRRAIARLRMTSLLDMTFVLKNKIHTPLSLLIRRGLTSSDVRWSSDDERQSVELR